MKTRLLTALAILPLLAGPIKAAPPTVVTVPIDEDIISVCSGESVHVTGDMVESLSMVTKNGITHISFHVRAHLDGVGLTSGESFTLNASTLEEQNSKGDFPAEANIVLHELLISRGGSPNEKVTISIHITINANGDVVVDRSDMSDDCEG